MRKKEFKYYSEGRLFRLKWAGGGEMPKELSGLYTSFKDAEKAAEQYLAKRDGNGKDNARAK